jgi:membrane protease YdiL (CAAX protease family)
MDAGAEATVAAAGLVAVIGAWYLIRERSFSIWPTTGAMFVVLGILSLIVDGVPWAEEVDVVLAVGVGLGSGLALYAVTVLFFRVARRWTSLHRQTRDLYRHRKGSLVKTVGVGALVVSSGEELFWRGLVQGLAVARLGAVRGAAMAWGLYVAANVAAGSLPIALGAVVGGGVWGILAWWSGGVAATVASHITWTALMIARPPHE